MVSEDPISNHALLERFTKANQHSGAIVSFSGNVRIDRHDGGTQSLLLQPYEPITSQAIETARQEALTRWALDDAYIQHRTGEMLPGETIVFVATAAKHRRNAFLAADFLMDYLKTQAFFWKKEFSADGEKWIEPKETDYQDAARWENTRPKCRGRDIS